MLVLLLWMAWVRFILRRRKDI
ncbi:hypothetical protein Gotur_032814 [Gossypium turneri]